MRSNNQKSTRHYVAADCLVEELDLWPGDVVQVGFGGGAVCYSVDGLGGLTRTDGKPKGFSCPGPRFGAMVRR
jgi:hypothetical protein